jgi:hypothetical protein
MPGYLLNLGCVTMCPHGAGQGKPTAPNPRVRLSGMPVPMFAAPFVIAGCPNPPPPANIGPCVTAIWSVGTVRVRSMGMPLLCQTSVSTCAPTPGPLSIAFAGQARVKGM